MTKQPTRKHKSARLNPLRNYRWGFLLLLAIVIAACTPPVAVVTLTVSPASATVTVGDGPTTFTATLTGSTDTVNWALSGPGTLSTPTGSSTAYTPPASGSASTATLTATAGGKTATATITINGPTLTISPSSATVTIGGSATTFTATLSGSSDTINWALSGPGSLSTTTGTSTAYTPPASGTAGSATLTATAGSLTANVNITINAPSSITVSGKVVDLFGQPQNALAVKIGSSTTNTDTNGNFSIANVTPPYNAIVVDSGTNSGYVFEGLTRSDPTLQLFTLAFAPPANSATINTGNLSGGAGFPNPASHNAFVSFGSPEGFSFPVGLGAGGGPGYGPTNVNWAGASTTTGALHALQFVVDGAGLPTDYTGYGTKALALSNGGTFNSTATDVVLSAGLADASLTGSSSLPAGYTPGLTALYADFGINQSLPLLFDFSPSTNFTYTTPNVPGASITTAVQATAPSGLGLSAAYITGSAPNTATAALTVPEVPELILPANNATGISITTPFSWQPFPTGIHVALFNVGGTSYFVTTANSQTTIPDLSAEGLPLPAAAAGSWQTVGIAPYATTDAAAGPAGYAQDFLRVLIPFVFGPAPEADGSFGFTNTRAFTTP